MAGHGDEMFMTKNFNIMPKITEQDLLARSDKSVAWVTNNKRLYSMFCTVEANYRQTRSIARPLCESRATCWVTLQFTTFFTTAELLVTIIMIDDVTLWSKLISLLDFINFISSTDVIQDVSSWRKSDLLALGGGSFDSSDPLGYGPAAGPVSTVP